MNLKQPYCLYVLLLLCGYTPLLLAQGYTTHQGLKIINPASPTNIITLNPPSSITSYTLTLPTAAGTNGQVLQTDGSGNLAWATVGSSGWSLTGNSGTSGTNFIGTTDAQPLLFRTNNTQVASLATDGSLRIGYTASSLNSAYASTVNRLFMEGGDESYAIISGATNTAGAAPHWEFIRSRGSSGSYTDVQMGDEIGQLRWRGYYGSTYNSLADISAEVDSTPASGNVPGRLIFSTVPVGGGTSFQPRMTIKSSGEIGIATQSPVTGSKVDIAGNLALSNSNNTAPELRFYEPSSSGSNYTSFKAQSQSSTINYTLPAADGSSGAKLETDGSGTLSWSNTGTIKYARKTANESVTSSTTLQDDDHLTLSVGANEVWECEVFYKFTVSSNTNGGVKLQVNVPSGASILLQSQAWLGYDASSGYIGQDIITGSYAFYYTNLKRDVDGGNIIRLHGMINVGSTAGNVSLQFSQQASSGTSTTAAQNSYIRLIRIQ